MEQLTDEQKAVLDFERQRWKFAGAKEEAIREQFGCSAVRFYQQLNHIIDLPGALAHDPVGVKRLQRLRDARARQRRGRRAS